MSRIAWPIWFDLEESSPVMVDAGGEAYDLLRPGISPDVRRRI